LFVLNGDEKSYGVKNNTIKRNNSTLAGKKSARRGCRYELNGGVETSRPRSLRAASGVAIHPRRMRCSSFVYTERMVIVVVCQENNDGYSSSRVPICREVAIHLLLISLVPHGLPRRYAPRNDGEYT
jgi:hypothetical protein